MTNRESASWHFLWKEKKRVHHESSTPINYITSLTSGESIRNWLLHSDFASTYLKSCLQSQVSISKSISTAAESLVMTVVECCITSHRSPSSTHYSTWPRGSISPEMFYVGSTPIAPFVSGLFGIWTSVYIRSTHLSHVDTNSILTIINNNNNSAYSHMYPRPQLDRKYSARAYGMRPGLACAIASCTLNVYEFAWTWSILRTAWFLRTVTNRCFKAMQVVSVERFI